MDQAALVKLSVVVNKIFSAGRRIFLRALRPTNMFIGRTVKLDAVADPEMACVFFRRRRAGGMRYLGRVN
jgi:hypothetical protein